ncbi:MAG: TIGR02996 domain-containing protein [Kofleriaceae bacterium]
MKRNAELEAAIVAAPDDPEPRMIYGDWLQAQGDPRGEWAALRTRLEAAPDDHVVRVAAIDFEADHKKDLFGAGAKAIGRSYIGWNGGFVDELRIHPHTTSTAATLKALFAHPTVRFVRHVAIGPLPKAQRVAAVTAMAHLPLLQELVIQDAVVWSDRGALDAIAKLPITKLSLSGTWLTKPMPGLRELTILFDENDILPLCRWIGNGGCKGLEKLTLVENYGERDSQPGVQQALARGAPQARLEHIYADQLFEPDRLRTDNPILALATSGGRTAIRHIPMAGAALYNGATHHMIKAYKNARTAIPLMDIAATLPTYLTGTYQLANAAIAHERAGDLIGAELRAREALLYSPTEPNYYAIAIDAMRRTKRLDEAVRLLPKAIKSLVKPPKDQQAGGDKGCLLDCMMLLAQVGKPDEAIALAERFPKLVDARIHAVLAVIHMQEGKLKLARAAWKQAAHGEEFGIWHHAQAVLAHHDGDAAMVKRAIAGAKKVGYGDMHWLKEMVAKKPAKAAR